MTRSTLQPLGQIFSGRSTPFGDISQYPDDPVAAAKVLWDNGYKVIPFRIWTAGGKSHKVPSVRSWKPYTLSWPDCERLVQRDGAFGIVVPAGMMVVDLDAVVEGEKKKFEGLNNLLDLSEVVGDNLEFLDTVTVNTPSGGMHLWYRIPPMYKLKNSASSVADKIDIRAPGDGLILMPPSRGANGQPYVFDLDYGTVDSARAPGWLLGQIRIAQEELRKELEEVRDRFKFTGDPAVVDKYLEERTSKIRNANQGSRNNILNAVAYSVYKRVADGQVPIDKAEIELERAAGDIGLAERETRATMSSARRACGL